MVYLSSFKSNISTACGMGLAPVRGDVDGPAPKNLSPSGKDIVDEALEFFRPNILFKNFEIEGPADITLLYLIIFINHALQKIENEYFHEFIKAKSCRSKEKVNGNFPSSSSKTKR